MAAAPLSSIGLNIATLRKSAGYTQPQLARRARISQSLLSKIETGDRAATHAVVAAVATALRTTTQVVYGQPYTDTPDQGAIEALRTAVRRYDLFAHEGPIRPLAELRDDIAQVAQLRRDARYSQLAPLLPGLLQELAAAVHQPGPRTAEQTRALWTLLADTYGAAHTLAFRLGHPDLAETIADRLRWCADHAEDPALDAVAAWTRAGAFQAAGDYALGLAVLESACSALDAALDPASGADTEAVLVALGSLHLRAATIASRAHDQTTTRDHLAHAEALTAQLARDATHHHLTFGPVNTTIHTVAANLELGRPRDAITLADRINPAAAGLPATRIGHHHIDLARAYLAAGDLPAAVTALHQARAIAPEQTRSHPMVRETARVLASLHRRSNTELAALTTWLGLPA